MQHNSSVGRRLEQAEQARQEWEQKPKHKLDAGAVLEQVMEPGLELSVIVGGECRPEEELLKDQGPDPAKTGGRWEESP